MPVSKLVPTTTSLMFLSLFGLAPPVAADASCPASEGNFDGDGLFRDDFNDPFGCGWCTGWRIVAHENNGANLRWGAYAGQLHYQDGYVEIWGGGAQTKQFMLPTGVRARGDQPIVVNLSLSRVSAAWPGYLGIGVVRADWSEATPATLLRFYNSMSDGWHWLSHVPTASFATYRVVLDVGDGAISIQDESGVEYWSTVRSDWRSDPAALYTVGLFVGDLGSRVRLDWFEVQPTIAPTHVEGFEGESLPVGWRADPPGAWGRDPGAGGDGSTALHAGPTDAPEALERFPTKLLTFPTAANAAVGVAFDFSGYFAGGLTVWAAMARDDDHPWVEVRSVTVDCHGYPLFYPWQRFGLILAPGDWLIAIVVDAPGEIWLDNVRYTPVVEEPNAGPPDAALAVETPLPGARGDRPGHVDDLAISGPAK